mgnify:FL=1
MKLQLLLLILAYFFIYVLVLAVYWAFKYTGVCAGEWACVFDEEHTLDILTITSYMLTPALGIGGFLSWKIQHNRGLLAEEAKHLFLAVNTDLKNLQQLQYLMAHQAANANISDLSQQLSRTYQDLRSANLDIYADALVLYEMSDDERLLKIRDAYHDAGLDLLQHVKQCVEGMQTPALAAAIDTTLAHKKHLNHQFKQALRQYIIFK